MIVHNLQIKDNCVDVDKCDVFKNIESCEMVEHYDKFVITLVKKNDGKCKVCDGMQRYGRVKQWIK